MSRFQVATLALACALALAPASPAAAAGHVAEIVTIDHDAHPEVAVTITLTSAPDALAAADVVLTENGEVRPVTIEPVSTDGLQVALVLDTSESMSGAPLAAAKAAATAFLDTLPGGVEVTVIGFSTTPSPPTPFSADRSEALASVAALEASGETALYDALEVASGLWGPDADARRAIVVLSDGGDTVSGATLEGAIAGVLGTGADFYAIELTSPELDPEPLARMAAATGGSVVPASDPDALAGVFADVGSLLINRYQVTYTSAAHGATDIELAISSGGTTAMASGRAQLPAAPAAPATPPQPAPEPSPPVTTVPAPLPSVQPAPGLLASSPAVLAGLSLLFLGLFGIIRIVQTRDQDKPGRRKRAKPAGALAGITNRATLFAEQRLERRESGRRLELQLERAGIALRPGEFIVLTLSIALGGAATTALFLDVITALAVGGGILAISRLAIARRARKRQEAFGDQLGDALQLIAGGLQAGHGITQAMDAVANEDMPPASDEFRRLVTEVQLGRPVGEALRAMGTRVGGEDFEWVIDAIEIHREVGGDLADILQTVAETIRDRNQIRRRVTSLSAEGRMSGFVLMGLPFVVAGFVTVTNPSYMAELTQSGAGKLMVLAGLTFMTFGVVWIRRITRVDF